MQATFPIQTNSTIGTLLAHSAALYKQHFISFAKVVAPFGIISTLLQMMSVWFSFNLAQLAPLSAILSAIVVLMLTGLAIEAFHQHPLSLKDAYYQAGQAFWAYFITIIASGLVFIAILMAVGLLLLFLVSSEQMVILGIPATLLLFLTLWLRFSLFIPCILKEKLGGIASLRRSWQLTSGYFVKTLAYNLCIWSFSILLMLILIGIRFFMNSLGVSSDENSTLLLLGGYSLISLLILPFPIIAQVVFYFHLRASQEEQSPKAQFQAGGKPSRKKHG